MQDKRKMVAVVGSGPAALMTATVLSSQKIFVKVFEKRKSLARKLLVAGASGLNITNSCNIDTFAASYTGANLSFWNFLLKQFSPGQWINFIESLGISTFEGTSTRWFISEMKAPSFLKAWQKKLISQGVEFFFDQECVDFKSEQRGVEVFFNQKQSQTFDAVCFALGGGSYESETPRWPSIFKTKKIQFNEFQPSNVGYEVCWTKAFLEEACREPLKGVVLTTSKGSKKGDILITEYGVEGTPVYFVGTTGEAFLDLKPELTEESLLKKCNEIKENKSPIRRIQKKAGLNNAALALLYHLTPNPILNDLKKLISHLKHFPIQLQSPRPLEEAISSKGGIDFSELCEETLSLKKFPNVYIAGEMLDWDAPTGGFLIQACVSQGYLVANSIAKNL